MAGEAGGAGLGVGWAVGRVGARPPQTLSRLWAAGLLGGLIAHALYSLTDAVALGAWAGVPLWITFGLGMGASRGRGKMTWSSKGAGALGGGVHLARMGMRDGSARPDPLLLASALADLLDL